MSTAEKCIQPCRCEYVQRWLDIHEKYFPTTSSKQHPSHMPYVACPFRNSQENSQVNYSCGGRVVTSKLVQIPYVIHAPHRISPVKPIHK